jgi:large subunit ribosomal protein L30
MAKIIIKQKRSNIGISPKQKKNLFALGLRKINAEREHEDNAVTRGMLNIVNHLVEVVKK